ncbi:MAG: ral nucleoside transport system permease protein [Pseudonocardiales bacterium]|nr:ral nucleoside transport system permease protein [Pseudonocardiales bacterium]
MTSEPFTGGMAAASAGVEQGVEAPPVRQAETPPVVGTDPAPKQDAVQWRQVGLVTGAYLASLACFGVIVALKGANPLSVYHTMIHSTLLNGGSLQQTVLRAIPIALAALAVSVPARAGLVNVGGEGQLIVGAVAATGIGVAIGSHVVGPLSWVAMCVAGALAGAVWAGICGVLRTRLGANEAVTTLLMNFVANDVMLYLIYQPWKDPNGSGQPQSRPLAPAAHLPKLFGSQLDIGLLAAAVIAYLTWFALKRTGWGFALRVVGGNREAARRAGLRVNSLLVSSMLVGGALAGLGGALNLAGVETQLRPGITITFGYVAFLASYLGRHDPLKVVCAALLFSAIALSGNGLQLTNGLDGAIVDVLLGLIVLAPLALAKNRGRSRS